MRLVYGLVGIALVLAALGSCTSGLDSQGGIVGAILLLTGLLCLFAGDALHYLDKIHKTLTDPLRRIPPP